ncbi:hypothetical protein P3T76_001294 [Phytophthora citrophthora]|uniref:Crinkler effector protein N-terminal domain-containing protein n=1 Tax=Phytophthora citrophthora TaxID=4793 RepID=A0AAD9GZT9_9STRA|nr:hypothetical protein P3T76_001282 [Phytophthora citrophthora]KAK1947276.1 hypothetical protein P3T76_001286 [Phytophthora citrophthora]KAK1947278.1 hypothetical protein P3T76_001288 [Phytophthora citrophthora]KAK1947280.1 hypothetical protein P3T76_001290 [Phytophthora citrophthora]KAK1947282.1 hypothetical protein P3T76_001292 [Phytophthora citrophthora]
MTAMLICAVVGVRYICSVDIELSATIDDLKMMIKKEMPSLVDFDADILQLYLAKEGDKWLAWQGEAIKALRTERFSDRIRSIMLEHPLLDKTARLDDDACFGKDFKRRTDDIHVLVELPHESYRIPSKCIILCPTTIMVLMQSSQGNMGSWTLSRKQWTLSWRIWRRGTCHYLCLQP